MQISAADLGLPNFKPVPGFTDPWAQTVFGRYWPQRSWSYQADEELEIELSDGDRLLLLINRPTNWTAKDRFIRLVHGLVGDSESTYMIRMAQRFVDMGYACGRLNLRMAGRGKTLARKIYHSGRSQDTRDVCVRLKTLYPDAPVTQIGVSLGANITLKMLGEDGQQASGNLDSAVAISAPIDLAASVPRLQSSAKNRFFDRYFVKTLHKELKALRKIHPHIADLKVPKDITLTEFDEHFTAPFSGFKSAADYYQQSSALPKMGNIQVPTLVLYAEDDPIVPPEPYRQIPTNKNIRLVITRQGGHVGFLGTTGIPGHFRWMDEAVTRFVFKIDSKKGGAIANRGEKS